MYRIGVVLLAVSAMVAGFYFSARQDTAQVQLPISVPKHNLIGSQRPDFRLGSITGEFVSPADFPGKTLLINFWATWCVPCRKEMPMLMALQAEYEDAGLQVIGVALDDVQSVRDFVEQLDIQYPILVGAGDVMLINREYGNLKGVLPYSVLVDRQGIVRWQYAGEIDRNEVSSLLEKMLTEAKL